MFAMIWAFSNIDYSTVFSLSPYISENVVTLICICLLIGAMAKSSQLGLSEALIGSNFASCFRFLATAHRQKKFSTIHSLIYAEKRSNTLISSGFINLHNVTLFSSYNKFGALKLKREFRHYSTDLTIWGKNLTSAIREKFNKNEIENIKLPYHIKGIIIGLIICDTKLNYSSTKAKNVRLKIKQSLDNYKYLWLVFFQISHYCSSYPIYYVSSKTKLNNYMEIQTRSLVCFTELYHTFYKNEIKIIPENIFDLLSPIALAYWVMGYGNFTKSGLILFTYSYNYTDVVILLNVLIIKYRLSCRLINSNGKPAILIPAECLDCLIKIIITYLIPGILNGIPQNVSNASNNNLNLEYLKGQGVNQQGIMSIQPMDNNNINDFNKNINMLNNISFDHNILNRYNKNFLEWFIGFSEGDGSFVLSKGGKNVYTIHLHIVDLPLLYEIKAQLNMGNIYSNAKSAYLFIKSKDDIKTLIEIFNGNLVLHKRKLQFDKWALNFKSKYNLNFDIKSNKINPTLTDSWLAGFIDAEGSFIVTFSKTKITQRFVLGQKDAELEFLYISKLINGYTEKNKIYDRVVVNYSKMNTVIDYLSSHKLISVKAKSLEKWLEIYRIRKNKVVLNENDYKLLKKKASLINSLRKMNKE